MSALLRSWAAALGGALAGASILCPGPGHSRKDRSLSVTPSIAAPDGFLVHSHAGDDWAACRDYVRARLGMPGAAPLHPPEPAPERNPNVNRARIIWRESVDIKGTIAAAYLASRLLPLDDGEDWHRVLRFQPSCPFGSDRAPALIVLMRDIVTDEPRLIQRTRLAPDGKKIAKGAAIKIDADADVTQGLCIGGGLETCLTARQYAIKPVWALGSVGAIAAFPVLAGIDALTILAETGDASARAINECGNRWEKAGREVYKLSPKAGSDLNDALREIAE